MSDGGNCHYCKRGKCICTLRAQLGRFTREEIASIFQVPLRMLPEGIFANAETQTRAAFHKPKVAKRRPEKRTNAVAGETILYGPTHRQRGTR